VSMVVTAPAMQRLIAASSGLSTRWRIYSAVTRLCRKPGTPTERTGWATESLAAGARPVARLFGPDAP